MPDGAAVDAARLAGNPADRVDVVNGVVEDFGSRRPFEEAPEVPRLIDHDAHVDVDDRAQGVLRDEIAKREHPRTES